MGGRNNTAPEILFFKQQHVFSYHFPEMHRVPFKFQRRRCAVGTALTNHDFAMRHKVQLEKKIAGMSLGGLDCTFERKLTDDIDKILEVE